ncbi:protein C15orf41 homolog [Contarinia nasturtii]|uniref:protein C15orf41 homolog n=1 Tax=Contarinia nasturtii TaxID=265458 RepID=UPI0012D3DCD7|nr:protein C15orf41 homolog [Contarinia nasturtii]
MVIISTENYEKIVEFCSKFKGLTIHCERQLHKKFSDIDSQVLSAILSKEWQKHIKQRHHIILKSSRIYLQEYKAQARLKGDPFILLQIAIRENFSPVSLCRILLSVEFEGKPKSVTNEMIRNPHQIPDPLLAANVLNCLLNDKSDGPITDLKRQTIGEDYEIRLKKLASDAGLNFHDEVYLRRKGYDKTPDLKLAVPCMFRGKIINWIESKASFGDMASHQQYIKDQLLSYGNRFGSGIIIYWFGYLDQIGRCPENKDCIIVTDDFPKKDELVLINNPFGPLLSSNISNITNLL